MHLLTVDGILINLDVGLRRGTCELGLKCQRTKVSWFTTSSQLKHHRHTHCALLSSYLLCPQLHISLAKRFIERFYFGYFEFCLRVHTRTRIIFRHCLVLEMTLPYSLHLAQVRKHETELHMLFVSRHTYFSSPQANIYMLIGIAFYFLTLLVVLFKWIEIPSQGFSTFFCRMENVLSCLII